MNIEEMIEEYTKIGYNYEDASSKVCQDILLLKISKTYLIKSKFFNWFILDLADIDDPIMVNIA